MRMSLHEPILSLQIEGKSRNWVKNFIVQPLLQLWQSNNDDNIVNHKQNKRVLEDSLSSRDCSGNHKLFSKTYALIPRLLSELKWSPIIPCPNRTDPDEKKCNLKDPTHVINTRNERKKE